MRSTENKELPVDIRKDLTPSTSINFANNELFNLLIRNPNMFNFYKNSIIEFLIFQNNINQIINQTNIDLLLKNINKKINRVFNIKNIKYVFPHCNDKEDNIIKMYYLTKLTKQTVMMEEIQNKMSDRLQLYFLKKIGTPLLRGTDRLHKTLLIAKIFDCDITLRLFIYDYYWDMLHSFQKKKTSTVQYYAFLNHMENCGLLDKNFANEAKKSIDQIDKLHPHYNPLLNLLYKKLPEWKTLNKDTKESINVFEIMRPLDFHSNDLLHLTRESLQKLIDNRDDFIFLTLRDSRSETSFWGFGATFCTVEITIDKQYLVFDSRLRAYHYNGQIHPEHIRTIFPERSCFIKDDKCVLSNHEKIDKHLQALSKTGIKNPLYLPPVAFKKDIEKKCIEGLKKNSLIRSSLQKIDDTSHSSLPLVPRKSNITLS